MFTWMNDHQALLWLVSGASIALFIASLFVIPFVVARIRPDYFAHDKRPARAWIDQSPTVRAVIHAGKNLLGLTLMIAGLAMLALPGPGLLTVLIGFLLIDFPGKYRFERWLIARPFILRPINWLRQRAGRCPLHVRRGASDRVSAETVLNRRHRQNATAMERSSTCDHR